MGGTGPGTHARALDRAGVLPGSRRSGVPRPSRSSASMAARRPSMARWSRDQTVPTGTPSTSATRSRVRPNWWWRVTTARCGMGRRASARSMTSRSATRSNALPDTGHTSFVGHGQVAGSPCRAGLRVARIHDEPVGPCLEPAGVAQAGQVAPDAHQRPLGRLLGEVVVPEDRHCHSAQTPGRRVRRASRTRPRHRPGP